MAWERVSPILYRYLERPELYCDPIRLHSLDRKSRRATRQSERGVLLNKITAALYAAASLCAAYQLNTRFDGMIQVLSGKLSRHLQDIWRRGRSSADAQALFGRDRRAQKTANVLFDMLARHARTVPVSPETWTRVLACVLWLQKLDLLPAELEEIDDFRDAEGKELPSLRDAARRARAAAERTPPKSRGVFGFIASSLSMMWSAADDEGEYEGGEEYISEIEEDDDGYDSVASSESEAQIDAKEEERLATVARACVRGFGINALFSSTRFWPAPAVASLLRALAPLAVPAAPQNSRAHAQAAAKPSPPPDKRDTAPALPRALSTERAAVFCLERAADVIVSNKARVLGDAAMLWSCVEELVGRGLGRADDTPTYFGERLVVNMLRWTLQLEGKSGGKDHTGKLVELYKSLLSLQPQPLYAFAQRIVSALHIFLSDTGPRLGAEQWEPLLELVARLRYHPKAAPAIFEDIERLCRVATRADLFRSLFNATCAFLAPNKEGGTWTLVKTHRIFESLLVLYRNIPTLTVAAERPRSQADRDAPPRTGPDSKTPPGARSGGVAGAVPVTSRSSVEHDSLWLYAIATLCNLCGHARVEVKLQALQALRKALLPTGTRPRSANVWKKCFSYLIPAIDGIDPVSTTGAGSGAGSGDQHVSRGGPASTTPAATHGPRGRRTQHGDLKMGAATLVFQVFLHNLKELANMVDFHVFWLQVRSVRLILFFF